MLSQKSSIYTSSIAHSKENRRIDASLAMDGFYKDFSLEMLGISG